MPGDVGQLVFQGFNSVPERVVVSWSSGKDSAWLVHVLRRDHDFELAGLLTTLNGDVGRVAMHGVREVLLEEQARALGLALHKIDLPHPCPNEVYEAAMGGALAGFRDDGIAAVAFGDLFLEDIRAYRETRMVDTGLRPLFPIWNPRTDELAREMVASGLRAYVTCVDSAQLDPAFCGRVFDDAFLDDLPDGVDPCGENGEFHSFAFAGPMFAQSIAVKPGEIVKRDQFVFADLLPA